MIHRVSELTAADLKELGLYDPDVPDAPQRLELLEYLISLGATADDLVSYRDELAGLPAVLGVRGSAPLTVSEAADRAGISEEKLLTLIRAAGFPAPGEDDRVFSEQFAGLAAAMAGAEEMFGADAVLQLIRVMGAAMARLADAVVSMFLVNVEQRARDEDPIGLGLARANAQAAELVPGAVAGLDILLRQHILAARRTIVDDPTEIGFETQRMAVGFVDLVGSSALAQRASVRELGALLTEFEHIVTDSVTARGGRVVKLIGDAVLYVADDEATACRIALDLTAALGDHPRLPPVRAGLASGDVVLRDGDVFGPIVNLAARAAKVGAASEIVAPATMTEAAGVGAEPIGAPALKGIDEPVQLARVLRHS
jgi:class 3 adenylate cyclase